MRIVLYGLVAVFAGQSTVNTSCVFAGINRNALAFVRGHSRLPVTGEAAFILLERMGDLACART